MELEKRIPKFRSGNLLLSGDQIFYTIQGEGVSVGCPAIFIRLHMCNLQCDWSKSGGEICDAWYTWKKDSKEYYTEHSLISFNELFEKILSYKGERIVFTGGEPLMQQDHIGVFLEMFPHIPGQYDIEIETNGTYEIKNELLLKLALKGKIQINCSPKLSSSGNDVKSAIKGEVLRQYNNLPNSYFKFVISTDKDVDEVKQLVNDHMLLDQKILIMPEGTSKEKVAGERMLQLIKIALENNWRISPRLQCEIWGNKRGV